MASRSSRTPRTRRRRRHSSTGCSSATASGHSTTALALIVLFGTPSAWLLATRRFRGRSLVITLVELPLVLPPAVAGIGLLAALGPEGLLGGALADSGIQLVL